MCDYIIIDMFHLVTEQEGIYVPHSGSSKSKITTSVVFCEIFTLPEEVVINTINVSFISASQVLSFVIEILKHFFVSPTLKLSSINVAV